MSEAPIPDNMALIIKYMDRIESTGILGIRRAFFADMVREILQNHNLMKNRAFLETLLDKIQEFLVEKTPTPGQIAWVARVSGTIQEAINKLA